MRRTYLFLMLLAAGMVGSTLRAEVAPGQAHVPGVLRMEDLTLIGPGPDDQSSHGSRIVVRDAPGASLSMSDDGHWTIALLCGQTMTVLAGNEKIEISGVNCLASQRETK